MTSWLNTLMALVMSETERLSFSYPEWKQAKSSCPWWWAAADQVSWVITVQFVKSFKDPVAVGVCVKIPSSSASKGATDKIIMNIKAAQRFILTAAGIFPMPKFMVSLFYLTFISVYITCWLHCLFINDSLVNVGLWTALSRREQSFNWNAETTDVVLSAQQWDSSLSARCSPQ